ncbi:MAG: DUF1598 domain-containing protein [Planctomycetes bacterium]|nr:DUF1598 domain-containing protein [Planctomycetota bacterium]
MFHRPNAANFFRSDLVLSAFLSVIVLMVCSSANGQTNDDDDQRYGRAVGGISIDVDGLLSGARPDALGTLGRLRSQAMQKIPDAMNATADMRKISLRQLEAALEDCVNNNKPITDEIKYLAGLQRIRYVFVYPEQKDVVLVGVGEGWKVDAKGNVVGIESGRPAMLFDDLLVALRTARGAAQGGITCSIDPTPEGLQRMSRITSGPVQNGNQAEAFAAARAKALGMQQISIHGVPATSHFARVLVAADYRMKRLAMNFEPSPVRGLPSYLQMVSPRARGVQTPRFWLEPSFEALLHDADGLAFELCGSSVKAMTEEDYLTTTGNIQHSGKASRTAQRWADIMTKKYPESAVADPIFGELHNCMDMAVIGALIVRENLLEKAGLSLPTMMDSAELKTDEFNAPKQVESQGSVLRVKGRWVTTASGGVAINSWGIVEKLLRGSDKVATVRTESVPAENVWWWN